MNVGQNVKGGQIPCLDRLGLSTCTCWNSSTALTCVHDLFLTCKGSRNKCIWCWRTVWECYRGIITEVAQILTTVSSCITLVHTVERYPCAACLLGLCRYLAANRDRWRINTWNTVRSFRGARDNHPSTTGNLLSSKKSALFHSHEFVAMLKKYHTSERSSGSRGDA